MKTLTLLFPLSLLAVLAAGGCKPKTAPATTPAVNNGNGSEIPQAKPAEKPPESLLPQTLKVRFQGRNAEQWAQGLMDLDDTVATPAAVALSKIGEEGLRFFYAAMKSNQEQANYLALWGIDWQIAKKWSVVFRPLIVNFSEHGSGRVQKTATLLLKRIDG